VLKVWVNISSCPVCNCFRDMMLKSIITRLLRVSGFTRDPSDEMNYNEPIMITLGKSIETVQETGFMSSPPYRLLVNSIKLTEPKWIVQKMIMVCIILQYTVYYITVYCVLYYSILCIVLQYTACAAYIYNLFYYII